MSSLNIMMGEYWESNKRISLPIISQIYVQCSLMSNNHEQQTFFRWNNTKKTNEIWTPPRASHVAFHEELLKWKSNAKRDFPVSFCDCNALINRNKLNWISFKKFQDWSFLFEKWRIKPAQTLALKSFIASFWLRFAWNFCGNLIIAER